MSFKIAMIGLDTSHSVEFPRLFQSNVPGEKKIDGLEIISCLRFPSAFQSEEGQDGRQKMIEQWGVKVSCELNEVVARADGIMIEINDPALHLKYLKEVVKFGKPIFLDKPPAATVEEAEEIFRLVNEAGIPFWSASSLRFTQEVQDIRALPEKSMRCFILAPLGRAPAGSDIVWYGVHGAEIMVTIMGTDVKSVFARMDEAGAVVTVRYGVDKRAILDLSRFHFNYSGDVTNEGKLHQFVVTPGSYYLSQMHAMREFFLNGVIPFDSSETMIIQRVLNAAEESIRTGKEIVF